MKKAELFLVLLLLGSLWGFFEMLQLPVYLLCAIGLLFLVIGRRFVDIPGSSILIGLIVCFYKTYSVNFFICQWAGVMAVAISFDFFTSIVFKHNWLKISNAMLIGALTNISALIVFVTTVLFIFPEPYWVTGGMERILDYGLTRTLPAALISAFISVPLALIAVQKLSVMEFKVFSRLKPAAYIFTTICLWIAAGLY
ncbi:MAG: hypothetical protein R6W68_04625 [Ignavibacteriaceae bacterium]